MRLIKFLFIMMVFPGATWASGPEASVSTPATMEWRTEEITLSKQIRIEPDPKAPTRRDLLTLGDGYTVSLETSFPEGMDAKDFNNLTSAERESLHQARRDLLVATAQLLQENRISSVAMVSGLQALHLTPTSVTLEELSLKGLQPVESALKGERSPGKVRNFFRFLNEAIVLSTYQAAKHHWTNRQSLKGLTNEFGLQLTLKAEFQFGMGRFNIVKNLPVIMSLGYRRDTREVLLRVGQRRESMNAGTAFSAGVKVELRHYQRISSPNGGLKVEGVSWYPPGLPLFSAVADSGASYRSAGLVFGLNLADLIPGMYFVNTVNDFAEREVFVRSLKIPSFRAWVARASLRLRSQSSPTTPFAPIACRAVFGTAF